MTAEMKDLVARLTGLIFQLSPLLRDVKGLEKRMDEILKAPPMSREFLNRAEAALVCGVSVKKIDRWLADGTLLRVRDSKTPLIPVVAIKAIPLVRRKGGVDVQCRLKI